MILPTVFGVCLDSQREFSKIIHLYFSCAICHGCKSEYLVLFLLILEKPLVSDFLGFFAPGEVIRVPI